MKPAGHMTKGLQIQNESPKVHAAYLMSEPHLFLKEEKLLDIAGRRNMAKILVRRD